MNYTNRLGEITELRCRIDFTQRGIPLSQPTNPSCRYDFIADIGGKLIRIQCKTCHLSTHNTIMFYTCSSNWNTHQRHSYVDDIEYFYTNWMNQGYLIPVNKCSGRTKTIRLDAEENYHSYKGEGLYASDMCIDEVIREINPLFDYEVITVETNSEEKIIDRRKGYTCKYCGRQTSVRNGMCWQCSHLHRRQEDKPTREELKRLIRTMPFTHIAGKYSRTDNAIRKWCEGYGLPAKASVIKNTTDAEWANI